MMKSSRDTYWGLLFFLTMLFSQNLFVKQAFGDYKNVVNQIGGHLRVEGGIPGYDDESYFEPVGTDTGMDGLGNARLKEKLILSDTIYFEAHYEAFLKWGDTYEREAELKENYPSPSEGLFSDPSNLDQRRLFNLTESLEETDRYVLWHRLDRLFFSIKPSWGDIIAGRQAVTWGNGLIFNPMDIFNPFAPSDTIRDYKMGDDLVSAGFTTGDFGECSLLYVPRRDVETKEIDFESSSSAGKFHFFIGDLEMDVLGALHYDEIVLGLGATGYLGNAAWRSDLVWSTLDDKTDENGYFQFMINMDYSWAWFQKNMYCLVEYYHNSLGENDYTDAMKDPKIMDKFNRGELFTLGKNYVGSRIQVELHPLFNIYLGGIANVKDPSGIIQPWATWSVSQNSNLQLGANIFYGNKGSEYGGFLIPGTYYYTNTAPNAYVLFAYYF